MDPLAVISMMMTMMTTRRSLNIPCQLLLFFLLVLFINPAFTGYSWGKTGRDWKKSPVDEKLLPKFETTPTSVTALIGQTVFLQCRVYDLGDKVVSWIRTRDLQILTSGLHTFTSDSRFEVYHRPDSETWTLRIMSAQPRDEGRYECQVNTDPKMNYGVHLAVKETDMRDSPYDPEESDSGNSHLGDSQTSIMGPREQYVRLGSTVTFTCVVAAPYPRQRPPKTLAWLHAGRLVTFQAARGGISVDTEKSDQQTTSKLTVAEVTHRDGGNYTCQPADMRAATVSLIIVEGERTEAMQRDGSNSSTPSYHHGSGVYRHFLTFLCVMYWFRLDATHRPVR